jgi:TRAP-type mannitol/chloroaromatic compound transport system substrate-binding protein
MKHISRRKFIGKGAMSALAGGLLAGACSSPDSEKKTNQETVAQKAEFKWKMVTTWAPHFPILGEGVDLFAKWLEQLSNGRIHVQVYGGGELVPALEVFEAVSLGAVELGHACPYYWAGKAPAAQFFASVPFGMNAQQMLAWIVAGGGLELWRELYAPFGLVPFLGGATGVQMGGWYNRKIESLKDINGLKIRMPGLGGKVVSKAGGTAVTVAGSEVYTNLERGVIDATEWIGPYHDYLLGLHRISKYYYYPGWHEPGTPLEVLVNEKAYNSLPTDLQLIVEAACHRLHNWIFSQFEVKNAEYLAKLIREEKVNVQRFPDEVLFTLRKYAFEIYDQLAASDPMSRKVYDSYQKHRLAAIEYSEVSEKIFYAQLQSAKI